MANGVVILAIHLLDTLHTSEKLLLTDSCSEEADFLRLTAGDVAQIVRRPVKMKDFSPDRLLQAAISDLKYLTQTRIAYTFYWSSDYPPLLREIYEPPFVLFYRGLLPDPSRPFVAIVGTRRPTGSALRATFELGLQFGAAGIPVVSGLARGIDSAAHRGNIHGGGKTTAVLGSGIDTIYPVSNRRLAEDILSSGGMICSEFAPGVPPLRYHFPGRNRIISGLSRSVVVVEAPANSGALITADFCLEQGRDLYVHRCGLSGVNAAGCRSLAESGAPAIYGAEQVFRDWLPGSEHRDAIAEDEQPALESGIMQDGHPLRGVRSGGVQPELDFGRLNDAKSAGEVLAGLMRQEMNGTVQKYNGAYFRRSDRWRTRRYTPC